MKKGYRFRSKIAHGRLEENPEAGNLLADVEMFARYSLMYVLVNNDLSKTFSGKDREKYLDGLVPGGGDVELGGEYGEIEET